MFQKSTHIHFQKIHFKKNFLENLDGIFLEQATSKRKWNENDKIKDNLKRENTQEGERGVGRKVNWDLKNIFKHNKFKHKKSKYKEIRLEKSNSDFIVGITLPCLRPLS